MWQIYDQTVLDNHKHFIENMAESGKSSDPFFPSIRDAAQHTDDLPDDDSKRVTSADSDDKDDDIPPLQEVDSLCMTCGEQVCMF